MSGIGKRETTGTQRRAGMARFAVLVVALVTGYALLCPVAFLTRGAAGMWAVGAAALACLAGGVASPGLGNGLAFAHDTRRGIASGVVAGMLLRMAVPLAATMIVYRRGGALVEGGMVFYVLALYMVTLTTETWMALGHSMTEVSPDS